MNIADEYIAGFTDRIDLGGTAPWLWLSEFSSYLSQAISRLGDDYQLRDGIAIHQSAIIEDGVVLKAPAIIGPGVFIGAHAYLRNGVWLMENVSVGPACELKTTLVFPHSAFAHFNFVGDSIIGSGVNMEAGAVIANHYNERADKKISLLYGDQLIATAQTKFGAIVGDDSRIGANAVLSPGTLLHKKSIVPRLALVEQVK